MSNMSIATFMARHNRGEGFLAVSGGDIGASETGLTLSGANPRASFVVDMSSLSPADFITVANRMDPEAIRYYLYNKYPEFFSTYDCGFASIQSSFAMDGHISRDEIGSAWRDRPPSRAANMTLATEQMLNELDSWITDPRDRALLARIDIFRAGPEDAAVRARVNRCPGPATTACALALPRPR